MTATSETQHRATATLIAMPERIQLRRTNDWRKPAGAVVVSRPGRWGNPFTQAAVLDLGYARDIAEARRVAVEAFRSWLTTGEKLWLATTADAARVVILQNLEQLRGKDLCCWCPVGEPCHADVYLEFANRPPPHGHGRLVL